MEPSERVAPGRAGRPFDRSRDDEVLAHTIAALAEHDYEAVTIDDVALRAGRAKTTLYRRWPTKEDLVLAAVRSIGRPPEDAEPPDEGDLRADLLAVTDSAWLGGPERRLAVFRGLASAARISPRLGDAVREQVTVPYVDVYQKLLQRAVERGALAPVPAARLDLLARVIPAMASHALEVSPAPPDRAFFAAVVDDLVLPALAQAPPDGD